MHAGPVSPSQRFLSLILSFILSFCLAQFVWVLALHIFLLFLLLHSEPFAALALCQGAFLRHVFSFLPPGGESLNLFQHFLLFICFLLFCRARNLVLLTQMVNPVVGIYLETLSEDICSYHRSLWF